MEQWPLQRIWRREGYGYSRARQHAELRTRMGRAMLRIGTSGPTIFTASLDLHASELAYLEGWVQHRLNGGLDWFIAPVLARGNLADRTIRFIDISEPVQIEGRDWYRIVAGFETRAGTQINADDFTVLEGQVAIYGSVFALRAAMQALENAVNS